MTTAAKNILASLCVHSAKADKSGSFSRPTITKAAAARENGKLGGRPSKFQLVKIFTMSGGGDAALFRSDDGRELRVDFFDKARLEEFGLEANVEVYGVGRGWETPEGRPIRADFRKYMIEAILGH